MSTFKMNKNSVTLSFISIVLLRYDLFGDTDKLEWNTVDLMQTKELWAPFLAGAWKPKSSNWKLSKHPLETIELTFSVKNKIELFYLLISADSLMLKFVEILLQFQEVNEMIKTEKNWKKSPSNSLLRLLCGQRIQCKWFQYDLMLVPKARFKKKKR